ncbi:MAG: class I SAM-dependent methyltransferase [Chthonomonadales bacterium]
MSRTTIPMTEHLNDYLLTVTAKPVPAALKLREVTAKLPMGMMQISIEQGQLMGLLIQLLGAKKTLEIGTFTGYSALITALALPADGKVTACDVSDEWTSIGKPFWKEASVDGKIDLRLAPATETMDALIADGQSGTYDFAFIDADKSNYDAYYERALKLVRKGGIISVDNTLWYGKVADDSVMDDDTVALRALNLKMSTDSRVTCSLVPIGDGYTICLVK